MEKRVRKPPNYAAKYSEIQAAFSDVVSLVEQGWNISEALKKLKIDRTMFYANISPLQKTELTQAKTLKTQVGAYYAKGGHKL